MLNQDAVVQPRRFHWSFAKRWAGLVVATLYCLTVCSASAQDSLHAQDRAMQSAFGFRAGTWLQRGERPDAVLSGFYDIQLGDVLFEPAIDLLPLIPGVGKHGDTTLTLRAIGVETRLKISLWSAPKHLCYLTTGFNFVVWPLDATFGVPVVFSFAESLSESIQLDIELGVTPSYYLAQDRIAGIFGILAGLRFPVASSPKPALE